MGEEARKIQSDQGEKMQIKEKTAYLDQQIKREERQIKTITQSNTWKMTAFLRPIKDFFKRIFSGNHEESVKQLEARLAEKDREIVQLREEIYEKQLLDQELTEAEMIENLRQLKHEGQLLNYVQTYTEQKESLQARYQKALEYIARLYMNQETEDRNFVYQQILPSLHNEEIPEFMIRAGLEEEAIPLRQVASFRGSLNIRMREKQLMDSLPEWPLDDKRLAYQFAKQLKLPIPKIDENTYTSDTVPFEAGTVIKPVDGAGSRGVYLVHDQTDIYDVKRSEEIKDWDHFVNTLQKDLATGTVDQDQWMVEQLIYENRYEKTPARDLKFYSFYGKVGLILEIVRDPEVRQCWWTADGRRITTEKYDESLFKGAGVTAEEIEMVASISEKIPAPFIRIDFLKGEDGLVFGEFTPKPGNYHEFDQTTDQWLGDYFIEAQGRLMKDLLNGKEFVEYQEFFNKQYEKTM